MALESLILFETPREIFERVFRELKPRTAPPAVSVEFCRFANANSFIRLEEGQLRARITDVLEGAPALILEALAHILLGKLYRRETPRAYQERYRRYLNRKDMRRTLHLVRQTRGRKQILAPRGRVYDLERIFEDLNFRYFHGLMARPALGWSLRPSRTTLGHYDASHNAIVLSAILDREKAPQLAVEYVLFHEMLHLRFPVDHRGARRCVHTPEFKTAEKQFEGYEQAKQMLRHL
jgi:predicted metal-dependent hydrolase